MARSEVNINVRVKVIYRGQRLNFLPSDWRHSVSHTHPLPKVIKNYMLENE